jgi:YfiH family protein
VSQVHGTHIQHAQPEDLKNAGDATALYQTETPENGLNQGGSIQTKNAENRDSTSVQRSFRAAPNAESGCLQAFQTDSIVADGLFTQTRNLPLVIMTADCLPIVMVDQQSRALAVIHAGWRGLAGGIVQKALAEFKQIGCAPEHLHIWIGAAISQARFEVGVDVLAAFLDSDHLPAARINAYFRAISSDKYVADLTGLACEMHIQSGVSASQIEYAQPCTFDNPDFFSHRRDGQRDVFCGRMATIAWL